MKVRALNCILTRIVIFSCSLDNEVVLLSPEKKGSLMEKIGLYLKDVCDYKQVEIISTARIPVVQFRDPQHG